MPTSVEPIDLNAIFAMVVHAFQAVVCTIGFQFATAGLFVAVTLGIIGLISLSRGTKPGRPLLAVSRKIAIFCGFLGVPGLLTLWTQGSLPPVNQLVLNPFGLICLWGLITAHMCMEEMNFQWFADN